MLKVLDGMPDGVIGFEATGMLHAEDFRDVLLPALDQAAKDGDVRFVLVIPEFKGLTGSALWEDLKIGFTHLRNWKRIALISDVAWIAHATSIFGWMTPGQVRVFGSAERATALSWVAEP